MSLFKSKVISAASAVVILLSIPSLVSAQEINVNGFKGHINTTITSGFTARMESNDCLLLPGYNATMDATTVSATALSLLGNNLNIAQTTLGTTGLQAALTNFSSKNGAGCAKSETDGYGNTSQDPLRLGSENADDGKMNFPNSGDIIDATQKVFTEIKGNTDSGMGVNVSFIGSLNPVLDINAAEFRKLTNKAESQLENDLTLIDAYITTSLDTVDLSIGRLATSYGEATFLPIGMNGLVTSGLDLSKLRAPGSSIRDAIIPTEQVVAMFQAGEWGVEAYYQFGHDPVAFDPKGSFYGSDIVGTGAKNLLASGGYYEGDEGGDSACSYAYNVLKFGQGNGADAHAAASACNANSLALHTAEATRGLYSTTNLARIAQTQTDATGWAAYAATGRASTYQSAIQAGGGSVAFPGYDSTGLMSKYSTAATDTAGLVNVYASANIPATDFNTGATVALAFADQKFKEPEDAHDFGISAHRYFDDIGDGLDMGIYFSNYTSKIPYAQVIGKGGVLAGDHVGMYKYQFADYAGRLEGDALGHSSGMDVIGLTMVTESGLEGTSGAAAAAWLALANGAYGSGVGGGFTALSGKFDAVRKDGGNTAAAANSTTNYIAKNYITQGLFGNVITQANGRSKVFHNPLGLVTGYNTAGDPFSATGAGMAAGSDMAFLSYGTTLLPAITPLNLAQVQFVYPEDNQIFAASFNTNVNGTTIQGELAYRPDFKLGTALGDQINQISDASGASLALTLFAIESGQTTMHDSILWQSLEGVVNGVTASATGLNDLVQNIQRSSLPDISAIATASNQADYRSTAWIEYDTLSFDLGTTSAFNASHPVTAALGADSSALLTELGAVYIDGMDNKKNGFVGRNGFSAGNGEFLCLGIFQDLTDTQRSTIGTQMQGLGYSNFKIDTNLMDVSTYRRKASTGTDYISAGSAAYIPALRQGGENLQIGDIKFDKATGSAAVGSAASVLTDDPADGKHYYQKVTNIKGVTNIGASIVDAVFGNGGYCEDQMGADELSMTYRVIGTATYNNFNNSNWSMNPTFAWAHDFYGYGPSSLGGFVPGKQSLSLGLKFSKGSSLSTGLNYVTQIGDPDINTGTDRDYLSANVSYSF